MPVIRLLSRFWLDDSAQDLTEYTMIIALMVIMMFGLVTMLTPYINGMWQNGNGHLQAANTFAS